MKLSRHYYLDENVVQLARSFLGKVLVSNVGGILTAGIITETEAYAGAHDKASHAYGSKHTSRTAPMYLEGGHAYVYLIYGMHSLFNIVTGPVGTPHAVLVRALSPLEGIQLMLKRRKTSGIASLCNGPGKLSKSMGIHYSHSGESLEGDQIWIEDRGIIPSHDKITAGPRINIDYAEEDALLPYRFIYDHSSDLQLL